MSRVLIIDDEFGIAELLQAVLLDQGHTVMTAANGKYGLELIETESLDVVFLDYMMPIMDGAAVLRRMAATGTLGKVPVVMMSSIPEDSVAERCAGYVMFLRKPFSVFDVVDVVSRLSGEQT
jgi:CheY-like chemotaxis protein